MEIVKQIKQEPQHTDALGRVIKPGDCVAYCEHNELKIGVVRKINPKTIGMSTKRWSYDGSNHFVNRRPEQCVIVEGPYVTMHLMKKS